MTKIARGGTELMLERIEERVPKDLLDQTQIVLTRLTEPLDDTKIRIAYIHDLAGDPAVNYLKDGGWSKFHALVFVSNWQMQSFISMYNIPWSKCVVIQNGIVPIAPHEKPTDKVRLIYTPTPHRGLNILARVFAELAKKYTNIELDVYSSFALYGWDENDKQFDDLFKFLNDHPQINYHGTQSNNVVRQALKNAHIFAYPCTWLETSCLCLIEAMSANLMCVHSNLGALYETASNLTLMYHFRDDQDAHARIIHHILEQQIIAALDNKLIVPPSQKAYADSVYDIDFRAKQWSALLSSLVSAPREITSPKTVFDTTTGSFKQIA